MSHLDSGLTEAVFVYSHGKGYWFVSIFTVYCRVATDVLLYIRMHVFCSYGTHTHTH